MNNENNNIINQKEQDKEIIKTYIDNKISIARDKGINISHDFSLKLYDIFTLTNEKVEYVLEKIDILFYYIEKNFGKKIELQTARLDNALAHINDQKNYNILKSEMENITKTKNKDTPEKIANELKNSDISSANIEELTYTDNEYHDVVNETKNLNSDTVNTNYQYSTNENQTEITKIEDQHDKGLITKNEYETLKTNYTNNTIQTNIVNNNNELNDMFNNNLNNNEYISNNTYEANTNTNVNTNSKVYTLKNNKNTHLDKAGFVGLVPIILLIITGIFLIILIFLIINTTM